MKTADLTVGTAYAYEQRMDISWPGKVIVVEAPVRFTTNIRGSWHGKREAVGAKVAIEKQVWKEYEDGHTDAEGRSGECVRETVIETVESRWIHSTWEEWEEMKARRDEAAKAKEDRNKTCDALVRDAQDLGAKIGLNISSGWNQYSKQIQATVNGPEALWRLVEVLKQAVAAAAPKA